ncbi:MAG: hypothetical protein FJW14_07355 [Acidimicrobiia bacterium]|nr:hypothetical protein [Acidimicrobiia bacterium]
MKLPAVLCLLLLLAAPLRAHHEHHEIQVRSVTCGWLEGESLRDIRNASDFCRRSVPVTLQVMSAAAAHERLWIETSADVVAALRQDGRTPARALLAEWLQEWKRVSGYPAASVVLMYKHIEVGRAQTTLRGDTVSVR